MTVRLGQRDEAWLDANLDYLSAMGVVVRQGIKTMAVIYGLTLVSILASLFIYPLDLELYGTVSFFNEMITLIGSIVIFGLPQASIRFFPRFKEMFNTAHPLIPVFFYVSGGMMLVLFCVLFITRPMWAPRFEYSSSLLDLTRFLPALALGAFFYAWTKFFSIYITSYNRVALARLIENLTRIVMPVVVLAVILDVISASLALWVVAAGYIMVTMILAFFLNHIEKLTLKSFEGWRALMVDRPLLTYSLFGLATTLGTSLVFRVDAILVTSMISSEMNGVYGIGMRIGNLMSIPMASLIAIMNPVMSKQMHDRDYVAVNDGYGRSALTLALIGSLMFIGVLLIYQDLFEVIPNGDFIQQHGGGQVLILIAASRLVDMVTSANSVIIVYSKYFRMNLYFLLGLGLINIMMNLWLIPIHGIVGAAIATFVSMALYNLVKTTYIYYRFQMWPFDHRIPMVGVIGLIVYLSVDLLAIYVTGSPVFDLLFKSILAVGLFAGLTLLTHVSSDVNRLYHIGLQYVLKMVNR